jgi:type VI secretion system protein ImpL
MPGDVEADPEDVRLFFARFDESKRLFAGVPDEAARGWFKPGRKFFDDMARVRLFFAPFLDAQKPVRLPEVNVEMQFRVMKEHEVGANEIIDWTLTLGNEKATPFTKSKKLPWRPGMPVRLDLRWAKNAPREPVLQSAQRNVSIEDGTVVYRYNNRWSLLTALADLRASSDDLPDSTDREPVTLAVNVLTKPVAGGEADPRHPTILFLRWSLSGSDGQPLDLPKFPSTAPPLLRTTAEAMP